MLLFLNGFKYGLYLFGSPRHKKVFEEQENVCTILDRDMQRKSAYKNKNDIFFSPFQDIEDECLEFFNKGEFGLFSEQELKEKYNIQREPTHKDYSKSIWKMLIKNNIQTKYQIFEILSNNKKEVKLFKQQLSNFLNSSREDYKMR